MGKILKDGFLLGIWDGHDAGAALLNGDQIVFAINEERLSRRKLEAGFPHLSIQACLDYARIPASSIKEIAASTTDPAKTLTRLVPRFKEQYYLLRRRKKGPRRLDPFRKRFKYRFTQLRPNALSKHLSRSYLYRQLRALGFPDFRLSLIDHHLSHAQVAARCSGFKECLVMTLDGVGDGLSGSICLFRKNQLDMLKKLPARASLGIFFEHITNLLNMRELEDEGKVMALADYACPIEDRDNPLLKVIWTRGMDIFSPYSSTGMFRELKRILWRYPSEQFAYMAQRVLEENVLRLLQGALTVTGTKNVALAGGVFSNIKLNMKIAELDGVESVYIFPHMGDGGLPMGAAMEANYRKYGIGRYYLKDLYLGPEFSHNEIVSSLEKRDHRYGQVRDVAARAAELILNDKILLWFQGRMEIGPRALGNRSILARPDDRRIKDRLNLVQKKRVWYQPFCPSILFEDGPSLLDMNGRGDAEENRFMTTAFRVRKEYLELMEGVINIDGTCRPHLVKDENPRFRELLLKIKQRLGRGLVLNTSFNIHGEPMICTPDDALEMFQRTEIDHLFLGDFLVAK